MLVDGGAASGDGNGMTGGGVGVGMSGAGDVMDVTSGDASGDGSATTRRGDGGSGDGRDDDERTDAVSAAGAFGAVGAVVGAVEGAGGGGGSEGGRPRGRVSMVGFASRPRFVAVSLMLLACSICYGVFPSTLPPHLTHSLHLSTGQVGSVFAGVAALYAAFTPLVGALANSHVVSEATMAVAGVCMCAAAHLCFGPSPLLHAPESVLRGWRLWTLEVVGGGGMFGVGSAFAFVPLLPLMRASVEDLGSEAAEMTAGIFNGGYYLGELLGQLFGARMVDLMGFPEASTALAGALVGSAAIFLTVRAAVK